MQTIGYYKVEIITWNYIIVHEYLNLCTCVQIIIIK